MDQHVAKKEAAIAALDNEITSDSSEQEVGLRDRLRHFTFAQFLLPLSTGVIALLLAATPHRFDGLETIGKIFFIFALVMFVLCICSITTRFMLFPGSFRCSIQHPTESLFAPTLLLTVANLIGSIQIYGTPSCGPWLNVVLRVLFWIYCALAFVHSVLQYLHLFCGPPTRLTIQGMTPAWLLPIFPMMLTGTLAQIIAPDQPSDRRLPMIIGALSFQGLGWMVAVFMYAAYIHRLMGYGLPDPNHRPGMFIATGPPSFTGLALIGLAKALPDDYGYFAANPQAINILQVVALFVAIFLWVLAFWWFCITSVVVVWGARKMGFHMIWWGCVFPNVGFAIFTIAIGEQLESEGILWIGTAMTLLLFGMWIFVFLAQVRAVWRKDILMAGKDEDKVCLASISQQPKLPTPPPPPMAPV